MSNIFYCTSRDMKLIPDNNRAWLDYLLSVDKKKLVVSIEQEKWVRTGKQNDALHKYFQLLADALNNGGFLCKYKLGDKEIEIDWNTLLIKNMVWRPIQKAITGKQSTTNLDKISEINIVYDHLNRFFSNKPFFIHVPFPKEENTEVVGIANYPTESNKTAFD